MNSISFAVEERTLLAYVVFVTRRDTTVLTQVDMANSLAMTTSAYSRLEVGQTDMGALQLDSIEEILKVKSGYMLATLKKHVKTLEKKNVKVDRIAREEPSLVYLDRKSLVNLLG